MIDTIQYLNPSHTIARINGRKDVYTKDIADEIEEFKKGKTKTWKAANRKYLKYTAITGYEKALADYKEYERLCEQCDDIESIPVVEKPAKLKGYNSVKEVEASKTEHENWLAAKERYNTTKTESDPDYNVKEPTVLLRPEDLPVIDPPPALSRRKIPVFNKNFGKTLNQIKKLKREKIAFERDKAFEKIQVTLTRANGVKFVINATAKKRDEITRQVLSIVVKNLSGQIDGTATITTADDQDIKFTSKEAITISELINESYNRIDGLAKKLIREL